MRILGIESSCDETAAAVVENGSKVLSSIIFSQVPLHQPYGGVVPEIASRSHIEKIRGIISEAMIKAFGSEDWTKIDAIAATVGPGLASSLLVGWSAAKGLALALGKPLIAINHMQAHLHAVHLDHPEFDNADLYPQLGLAVSGGHTCFIDRPDAQTYTLIGQTLDDAAGEALDKAAKLLGLGYPGGPVIDKLTRNMPEESRKAINFPKGKIAAEHHLIGALQHDLCVSFSGLKTALMLHVKKNPPQNENDVATICASYQEAVVQALTLRIETALKNGSYKSVCIGGGVSLNRRLRETAQKIADKYNVKLLQADACYCGDNAAMIAGLASIGGGKTEKSLARDVDPSLPIDE